MTRLQFELNRTTQQEVRNRRKLMWAREVAPTLVVVRGPSVERIRGQVGVNASSPRDYHCVHSRTLHEAQRARSAARALASVRCSVRLCENSIFEKCAVIESIC